MESNGVMGGSVRYGEFQGAVKELEALTAAPFYWDQQTSETAQSFQYVKLK